jgi:hypothetical protein
MRNSSRRPCNFLLTRKFLNSRYGLFVCRVISRIKELGISAVTGGCQFCIWDRGTGGASRPRARPSAVLGTIQEGGGSCHGGPGINPGNFSKFCMQNPVFWYIMGNN